MSSSVVSSVTSSAPGKAILFGEHAVVYGAEAVAVALNHLRIHVHIDVIANATSSSGSSGSGSSTSSSSSSGSSSGSSGSSGSDSDNDDSYIEIVLSDISDDDDNTKPFTGRVSFKQLQRMSIRASTEGSEGSEGSDSIEPVKPDEETLSKLRNEFQSYPLPCSQGLMSASYLVANILPELVEGHKVASVFGSSTCLRINVQSKGLPIGAGLGSSAAFSVALAGALIRTKNVLSSDMKTVENKMVRVSVPPADMLAVINGWAYAAEVVIHGSPSGLDNTTSCYGGAIKYSKDQGTFQNLSNLPPMQILLTNTKVPRSTKQLVANVRKLYDAYPDIIKPVLSAIEGISLKFLQLIDQIHAGDITNQEFVIETGKLFNINHNLLCALGVGHSSLTLVHETSNSCGCACKLTGAGGGGCALTLLQPKDGVDESSLVLDLTKRLESLEFSVFSSAIGGDGVRWHDMYDL